MGFKWGLLLGALFLAVAVSFLPHRLEFRFNRGLAPYTQIGSLKREFQKTHERISLFRLTDIPQTQISRELIDPESTIPHVGNAPARLIQSLYAYATSCSNPPKLAVGSSLHKVWQWHSYLCGDRASLPEEFFERPPYMHPNGRSFAKLAQDLGMRANEKYLHVRETNNQGIFSDEGLKEVMLESPLVLDEEKVWLREDARLNNDIAPMYRSYKRDEFVSFAQKNGFQVSADQLDALCVLREGNVCWNFYEGSSKLAAVFLALSGLALLGATAFVLIQRTRTRRKEAAARTFALQTLAHELRIPATNLRLGLDLLRPEFDKLSGAGQDAFLRMCDETQRLTRIVEASKNYLKSDRFSLTLSEIPSMNAFGEAFAMKYEGKVKFVPLATDQKGSFDIHWVDLCLRNLVENSIRHGVTPVTLSIKSEKNKLGFEVSDGGSIDVKSLEQLIRQPSKSKNTGLGLGLSIVRSAVKAMKGELVFLPSPTTFQLWLRNPA